ncbi:hypothetical protein IYY11_00060 [Methylocystis sp. H62]|uniref:Uncharacterized protein n=1 Tax=Methylocystis rosea TaxID=173366 RepID=A0A3G8MEA1_9HYPH|nr:MULTISPECIES: hypothetical protein [Methylocystis]AZG79068.1 hypothetical protein EHO51_19885 [Methylocystis rosea]MBG0791910.1 hypothetical protein [Methylocystis sp. H62]MBG0797314.1 hypothetical protein [Methylocystis sp. L43]MBG0804661.1 hypothetical protein [Methylocystis sp. H15]QGM95907.1 hypothetical protein F7D13_17640 [Methylocystis rosea]
MASTISGRLLRRLRILGDSDGRKQVLAAHVEPNCAQAPEAIKSQKIRWATLTVVNRHVVFMDRANLNLLFLLEPFDAAFQQNIGPMTTVAQSKAKVFVARVPKLNPVEEV